MQTWQVTFVHKERCVSKVIDVQADSEDSAKSAAIATLREFAPQWRLLFVHEIKHSERLANYRRLRESDHRVAQQELLFDREAESFRTFNEG